MFSSAALLVLGLAPGIYARWSSRTVLPRIDDPLLPEHLLAHSRRVATAVGLSVGVGIALVRDYWIVLLALVFVSVQVGGFSVRRRVFGETRGLLASIGHSTRFWMAAVGYLILIAAIPTAVSAVSVAAGMGLGVVALVWAFESSSCFRRLLGARPLNAPEAQAAFPPILERAKCESPLLFEADAPGGTWFNAFALPSVRRSAVLFTRGLLGALSAAETTAIFAHEVAHLEHFTRKKVAIGLALTAVLATLPVVLWGGPLAASLRGWEWIWPFAVLAGLIARATKHRAHEGESDLRALELCRDADALVSGLTKLHVLNRVPRRWDGNFERMSSHPSLARRIHAIRRAAAADGEREAFQEIVRSADEKGSAVLFDAERLHWLRGIPESGDLLAGAEERRSLRYSDVRDLRLERRSEKDVLIFTDAEGRTTRMPVASEDVPSLQSLLDRLDASVGYVSPAEEPPSGRFWSMLLLAFSAASSFSFAALALAALALARPGVATLVAAGAGAVASALSLARNRNPASLLMAALGLACLLTAQKRLRLGRAPARTDVLLGTLVPLGIALLDLVGGAHSVFSPLPMMQLHSWAKTHPGFLAGVLALAAVLTTIRKTKARAGAAFLLLLAGTFFFLGSAPFRERFSEDVFARPGEPISVGVPVLEELRTVIVPGGAFRLALSPAGARVAAAVVEPGSDRLHGEMYRNDVFLEREPGQLDSFRAIAFDFVDEDRILVLDQDEGRAVLQLRTIATGSTSVIARDLPLLAGTRMQVDRESWLIAGSDWEDERLVVLRGSLGFGERAVVRHDFEDRSGALGAVNRRGWSLGPEYEFPSLGDWQGSFLPYASWFLLSFGSSFVTEMKLARPDEPSLGVGWTTFPVSCAGSTAQSRFVCSAAEADSTSLWSFDPETGTWESLGRLPGSLYPAESPTGQLVLNGPEGETVLVSLEHHTATRLTLPEAPRWGVVAASGNVVARGVPTDDGATKVTFYALSR